MGQDMRLSTDILTVAKDLIKIFFGQWDTVQASCILHFLLILQNDQVLCN